MFPSIDKLSFPERERAVVQFWNERQIYHQSLQAREGAPAFVFYEGPPTANGMPHPGHCLTRAIKDLYPRYKTMRGYQCHRKAGWDTHGLPVEVEVCKELGIHSKEEIEHFGVEPFIHKCQQSVWRYMQQWERLTERLGFWVDLEEAYVTYRQSYVESVWWSLKELFDRGLLYRGYKIVWWWAQGGTALSSGEVGQGYRETADPSVFVRFPLRDAAGQTTDTSLLVWTTTPWTLPSNQFAAVHPELRYAKAYDGELKKHLIVAEALVDALSAKFKRPLEVVETMAGSALVGLRYEPPFDGYFKDRGEALGTLATGGREAVAWRVVAADFVTTDSGSGVVHQAPAFGEVDYEVLLAERARFVPGEGPELLCAVGPDGKFTAEAPAYAGRWVKECDKDIARELRHRGLLVHQEQYLHDYPFCWRAEEDPLIQYPRESWFIRTTDFKDRMLANNARINWLPDHIKDGRFGKFLESNVDWALSRERYWGTPLPIWICDATGRMEAVGSYADLLSKPDVAGFEAWEAARAAQPDLPEDLRVHKPYIDAITYASPFASGARMRRTPEVIDCWYDSGAMPFAQWGYRGETSGPTYEQFASQFPADFISEAIDQTRGWFYSQVAISTLLWGPGGAAAARRGPLGADFPHPFKNCIVLGLMLGEDGQKMSKSKRNYREPNEIFDRYGADALRWYFFANQPPWTSIRYSEQAIKDSVPEFLLRLWNVFSFFTIYANIDGFDPAAAIAGRAGNLDAAALAGGADYPPLRDRGELDRWALGELHATCRTVVERMDAYDNFAACQAITQFVDGLSNWYVRRSRDAFWSSDKHSAEKRQAYWTLYECLTTTARLIAPFTPFLAESLWQSLAVAPFGPRTFESVHLCDYPRGDVAAVDPLLAERMELVRLIASLGRQARTSAELKVRQPLASVRVILANAQHQAWLAAHAAVICDELNVKQLEFSDEPEKFVDHEITPNFKLLGPKLGKRMPTVKKLLGQHSGAELLANVRAHGRIELEVDGETIALATDEVEIRLKAKPGWISAHDRGVVVVLAAELTPELIAEGLVRDLVRLVQERRKELGCEFTDRIALAVVSRAEPLRRAVAEFSDYLAAETLAVDVRQEPLSGAAPAAIFVGEHAAELYVQVAS
jgi:isoleucyl-tRNA synthetase